MMALKLAHDLRKDRTEDVRTQEDIDFPGMLLPDNILCGLSSSGFKKPSPIQLKAIPLGRCGFDLILQAKSGTGKTCVFSIVAIEMVVIERRRVQVLILAPTREIAIQITDVIRCIGSGVEGLKVHSFIGGTPIEEDKKKISNCHIAVGAPGRIRHLMEIGFLKPERIRLLVLDEADKLMESTFMKDMKYFFSVIPSSKQVIVASATMPEELDKILTTHMKSPVRVCPHGEGNAPILMGLRQILLKVPEHPNVQQQLNLKVYALVKLLSSVSFRQCIIFSNYLTRAESICHELERRGWPCKHTAGFLDQSQRMEAFSALIESRCRILLSTDLTARGVDAPMVDLVVNLDLPANGATYLHRIGRAGRYGSYGIAVTLGSSGVETCKFSQMLKSVGAFAFVLTPESFPENLWECDLDQFENVGALQNGGIRFENSYSLLVPSDSSNNKCLSKSANVPSEQPPSVTPLLKPSAANCVASEFTLKCERGSKLVATSPLTQDDVATLSEVLTLVDNDDAADCFATFDELVIGCEEFNDLIPNPEEGKAKETFTFAESFDKMLNSANLKRNSAFNERLEKCRIVGIENVLKKMSLGEDWLPEEGVSVESTKNQLTSWDMRECDVSLFDEPRKDKERQIRDRQRGTGNGVPPNESVEGRKRSGLKQRRGSGDRSLSDGSDNSYNSHSDSDSCCDEYETSGRRRDNNNYRCMETIKSGHNSWDNFNLWYQQVLVYKSQVEYIEYWNYMLRK